MKQRTDNKKKQRIDNKKKQRTDTTNEAKNWYQKWSKELIPKFKQRTNPKNEAKQFKKDQFIEINSEHFNGSKLFLFWVHQ